MFVEQAYVRDIKNVKFCKDFVAIIVKLVSM